MPSKNGPVLSKADEIESSTPEPVETPKRQRRTRTTKVETEKFWEVYFHDKRDEYELDYHYLAVNGEALQVTKGATVIIPERFLEVADHATIKKYKKGRPVGEVSRCPYRKIREATEAEYLKMKKDGTKQHKSDLDKRSRAAEKPTEG